MVYWVYLEGCTVQGVQGGRDFCVDAGGLDGDVDFLEMRMGQTGDNRHTDRMRSEVRENRGTYLLCTGTGGVEAGGFECGSLLLLFFSFLFFSYFLIFPRRRG